ncbi:MAG: hypothetical protein ACJZ02_04615 [Candidatus Neomarinimicrobiota bacterium]
MYIRTKRSKATTPATPCDEKSPTKEAILSTTPVVPGNRISTTMPTIMIATPKSTISLPQPLMVCNAFLIIGNSP